MNGSAATPPDEVEEGVGESSSPPRGIASSSASGDVRFEVYKRLKEEGNEEATGNPEFQSQLYAHFERLPPSYQLDINVDKAADVLIHQKVLAEAKDPDKRPAFHVRFLKHEDVNLDVTNSSSAFDDETEAADALSARHEIKFIHIHEVIFSTIDKPKLLSQLSALVSNIGLNIREAHVFSTIDGYSLDVFVVDGWPVEDTEGLSSALQASISKNEGSWSGSSHSSASDRILPFQAKLGEWEIDRKFLKMGDMIAFGSCGDLYHGNYFGEEVAIKVLRSEHLNEGLWNEFVQEINILREVHHPNVVRFIGACTKPPQYCIITELMSGGNLYDFLHKHNNILELSVILKLALDISRGMEYLHQKGIIHRDLKTANLLMDKDHVVKVADFGVARFQDQGGVMTAETGTYRWMAPEVINHQPYDAKADVFSFAIVLWELVTSKIPYDSMSPVQAALGVRQGMRPTIPENAHPGLAKLMRQCWDTIPANRPCFTGIIREMENIQRQFQDNAESSQPPG